MLGGGEQGKIITGKKRMKKKRRKKGRESRIKFLILCSMLMPLLRLMVRAPDPGDVSSQDCNDCIHYLNNNIITI